MRRLTATIWYATLLLTQEKRFKIFKTLACPKRVHYCTTTYYCTIGTVVAYIFGPSTSWLNDSAGTKPSMFHKRRQLLHGTVMPTTDVGRTRCTARQRPFPRASKNWRNLVVADLSPTGTNRKGLRNHRKKNRPHVPKGLIAPAESTNITFSGISSVRPEDSSVPTFTRKTERQKEGRALGERRRGQLPHLSIGSGDLRKHAHDRSHKLEKPATFVLRCNQVIIIASTNIIIHYDYKYILGISGAH